MCAPLAWRLETGYRCYRSLPSYRQIELHLGVEFTLAFMEHWGRSSMRRDFTEAAVHKPASDI